MFVYVLDLNLVILRFLNCFFFKEEEGIRDRDVTGVKTCAIKIYFYFVFLIFLLLCGKTSSLL